MTDLYKNKVLVVEDDKDWIENWRNGINKEKISLTFAPTVQEAEKILLNDVSFDAIVMDALLIDKETKKETMTFSLVEKIRSSIFNYKGPIIALSSSDTYRKELVKVGCNYQAPKVDFFQKLSEVLCF